MKMNIFIKCKKVNYLIINFLKKLKSVENKIKSQSFNKVK